MWMVVYYFTNGLPLPREEILAWALESQPVKWKMEHEEGRTCHTVYRWLYPTQEEAEGRVMPWECGHNGPWWTVEVK